MVSCGTLSMNILVSGKWVASGCRSSCLNNKIHEHIAASLTHRLQYLEAFDQVPAHTVTGDQAWAHHYCRLESKAKSVLWKHLMSSTTKKFRFTHGVGKVLGTLLGYAWQHPVGVHPMWELGHISGNSDINEVRNFLQVAGYSPKTNPTAS
jgi:hypothetical protein